MLQAIENRINEIRVDQTTDGLMLLSELANIGWQLVNMPRSLGRNRLIDKAERLYQKIEEFMLMPTDPSECRWENDILVAS